MRRDYLNKGVVKGDAQNTYPQSTDSPNGLSKWATPKHNFLNKHYLKLEAAIPFLLCSRTTEHEVHKQISIVEYKYSYSCIVYHVPGSGACFIIHYSAIILVISYRVIFQLVHMKWPTESHGTDVDNYRVTLYPEDTLNIMLGFWWRYFW